MAKINSNSIFFEDINRSIESLSTLLNQIKGCRFFISGGTGLFGKWIVATLAIANQIHNLGIKVVVLTRDSSSFLNQYNEFDFDCVEYIDGDIRTFNYNGECDYVIHAATDASADMNEKKPILMADTIIDGTRNILEYTVKSKASRFLYISSGAVYGGMPNEIESYTEEMMIAPDCMNPASSYSEAKRVGELYCSLYSKQYGLNFSSARCFAFVGPFLNLDIHFAIGNFIRNVVNGNDITVNGDGSPIRSYMYMSDLVVWLIAILIKGKNKEAYNVGSDIPFTIRDIATKVVKCSNKELNVILKGKDIKSDRNIYLPSIEKAKSDVGLKLTVDIDEAITRTIKWNIENEKN